MNLLLLIILLTLTACSSGSGTEKKTFPGSDEEAQILALQIHKEIIALDSHTDTPLTLLNPGFDISRRHSYDFDGPKVDFPRMRDGGLHAIFFAIFVRQGPMDREGYAQAQSYTDRMFGLIKKTVEKHPAVAAIAHDSGQAKRLKREGKIAVFIGIENGHALGEDLSLIRKYQGLGARSITLCHTTNNALCDSSTDPRGPLHNGLSPLGREAVKEMNRTGMIIDVSHVSDRSFNDIMALTSSPVIASHSNSRSICRHPRNLTDRMMRLIARGGGVINATLWSGYVELPEPNPSRDRELAALVKKYPPLTDLTMKELQAYLAEEWAIVRKYARKKPPLRRFVDHIDRMVKVAGIDHVGIGSDFDGGGGVEGCLDVSQVMNITVLLLRRGYGKEDIRKIWGGSMLRLLSPGTGGVK